MQSEDSHSAVRQTARMEGGRGRRAVWRRRGRGRCPLPRGRCHFPSWRRAAAQRHVVAGGRPCSQGRGLGWAAQQG
eukprot:15465852-Alexandrium_andersonii.AAC.1